MVLLVVAAVCPMQLTASQHGISGKLVYNTIVVDLKCQLCPSDGADVNQHPVRLHVRGSSSAVEYAKKSYSLDPVDQIADFRNSETEQIRFLGVTQLVYAWHAIMTISSVSVALASRTCPTCHQKAACRRRIMMHHASN